MNALLKPRRHTNLFGRNIHVLVFILLWCLVMLMLVRWANPTSKKSSGVSKTLIISELIIGRNTPMKNKSIQWSWCVITASARHQRGFPPFPSVQKSLTSLQSLSHKRSRCCREAPSYMTVYELLLGSKWRSITFKQWLKKMSTCNRGTTNLFLSRGLLLTHSLPVI